MKAEKQTDRRQKNEEKITDRIRQVRIVGQQKESSNKNRQNRYNRNTVGIGDEGIPRI